MGRYRPVTAMAGFSTWRRFARSGADFKYQTGKLIALEFVDPNKVHDRESFSQYSEWMIADRRNAENLEKSAPKLYRWGGASDWQNSSISIFLEAAMSAAEAQDDSGGATQPAWKDLANFLYLGKIYE